MTRAKYLAAAAVLSSLIASPVMARDLSQDATYQMPSHRSDRSYDRDYVRHDSGFWPAEVAAGAVGGAVGAAGAIATTPFRHDAYAYNDAYAYDNGDRYYMNDGQKEAMSGGARYSNPYSYAARNGFVCQPGTLVRIEDGQQHLCQ